VLEEHIGVDQRRGLVSAGLASRLLLTSRLSSRQVASSVRLLATDATVCRECRPVFVEFLACASAGVWPNAIEDAARLLALTPQLGMPLSATAARVRRSEASVGQNEMQSADIVAMP
jgi:hypothetical protein